MVWKSHGTRTARGPPLYDGAGLDRFDWIISRSAVSSAFIVCRSFNLPQSSEFAVNLQQCIYSSAFTAVHLQQ